MDMQAEMEEGDLGVVERGKSGRYVKYDGVVKTVYIGDVAWEQVVLSDEVLGSEEDLAILRREAKLLNSLKHENVVRCLHSWVDVEKKLFNRFTEVSSVGNVEQYLKKHDFLDDKTVKKWAIQILKGLNYLERHDPLVVHGDINCANLFVDGKSGNVKIGNLRLPTILQRASVAPGFMAPELYGQEYNHLVDIYSFGMCILQMVTKEVPYSECENSSEIKEKVISGAKPDALCKVSDPQMKQFIEKCLAPVSERRAAIELLRDPYLASSDSSTATCSSSANNSLSSSGTMTDLSSAHHIISLRAPAGELRKGIANKEKSFELDGKMETDEVISMALWIRFSDRSVDKVAFSLHTLTDTAVSVTEEMVKEFKMSTDDAECIHELMEKLVAELVPLSKPCQPKSGVSPQETASQSEPANSSDSNASKGSRFSYISVLRPSNRCQESPNKKSKRGTKKRVVWLTKLLFVCGNKF